LEDGGFAVSVILIHSITIRVIKNALLRFLLLIQCTRNWERSLKMLVIQPGPFVKKLRFIQGKSERHWVGDGFPVRTLFSYPKLGPAISPFLLFDYAGPIEFPPTGKRLGVGEHPYHGFETVTIVYSGEVEHRDSSGGGGVIGSGDVQWMTAASGIVHEDFFPSPKTEILERLFVYSVVRPRWS
jgi:hypothetical protein